MGYYQQEFGREISTVKKKEKKRVNTMFIKLDLNVYYRSVK